MNVVAIKTSSRIVRHVAGLLALTAWITSANASLPVTLEWDPSPDSSVVGYKIHYRDVASTNDIIADAGSTNVFTLTGLVEGTTYRFYVTAYNAGGLESVPSNSVDWYAGPAYLALAVGDRVQVTCTPSLSVRDSASASAPLLGAQGLGSRGTITGGPVASGGHTWWNINYDTGADGWSAAGAVGTNYLRKMGVVGSTNAVQILTVNATGR